MNIREFRPYDSSSVKEIHEKYYKEEFKEPDFLSNFLCAFVIHDNSDNIVVAGGVRTIAELVFVTDKSRSHRERREALYNGLDACGYFARRTGHDSLHAFVQDEKWYQVMRARNFQECKGKPLFIEV